MDDPRKFKPYLERDEVILWAGRPKQGLMFRACDIIIVPASLIMSYLFALQIPNPFNRDLDTSSLLRTIVYVSFVLYLFLARFLLDSYRRKKLQYVVTNQKIMIYPGAYGNDMRRINFEDLQVLKLQKGVANTGSILFSNPRPRTWWDSLLRRNQLSKLRALAGYDNIVKFEAIYDVKTVYYLIQKQAYGFSGHIENK